MDRRNFLKGTAAAGLVGASSGLAGPALSQGAAARTLRFVPQANLANFDPIWGTQYVVRNGAAMVWDTLYGFDAQLKPQRQMAESEQVSADGLTWDFRLRPGLKFHDGSPVLAKDVVASLTRWSARDPMGQMLKAIQQELVAVDDRNFRWVLKKPYPKLLMALGKNSTPMAFIMPERLAKTDPFQQIREPIGSGPFRFVMDEFRQGSRAVWARNEAYVPTSGGGAGMTAGPKVVHFDRIEWNIIPDAAMAAAALTNNEIDWF
ncbi:MAG: twin-arginine translocation signal domain-containing protein, partial [Acetobacteraceae bacterium]